MDELSSKDYRCTCRSHRRLASYGIDTDKKIFIHVKVYKGDRIHGEVVIKDRATVRLRCPACSRWHVLHISDDVKPPVMEVDRSVTHTYPNQEG